MVFCYNSLRRLTQVQSSVFMSGLFSCLKGFLCLSSSPGISQGCWFPGVFPFHFPSSPCFGVSCWSSWYIHPSLLNSDKHPSATGHGETFRTFPGPQEPRETGAFSRYTPFSLTPSSYLWGYLLLKRQVKRRHKRRDSSPPRSSIC